MSDAAMIAVFILMIGALIGMVCVVGAFLAAGLDSPRSNGHDN